MNHHLYRSNFAATFSLAALTILSLATARAAIIEKADNTTALNVAGSWTGGVVPGVNDIAQWDSTVSLLNTTNALGANLSWSGIQILNPASPVMISPGSTLTLGANGINLSGASQDFTIGSVVAYVNGAEAWDVANGRTLTLTNTFQKSATVAATVRVSTTGATKLTAAQGLSQAAILDAQGNPYMTYGLNDWAATDPSGNVIVPSYIAWTASIGATFPAGPQDVQASFTQTGNGGGQGLRFASATPYTVTMANATTYTPRGILVASTCGGGEIGGAGGFIRCNRSSGGTPYMFNVVQNSANNFTISCNLANSSASTSILVKSGPGNLILNHAGGNGYSSGTIIYAGTLTVNSNVNMGGGSVTVNQGTLAVYNGTTLINPYVTFANGTTNKITITSANGQCAANLNYTNLGSLSLQFAYGSGVPFSTTAAPLLLNSNLSVNGAVSVSVQSGNPTLGTFPLLKWTNAISAPTFANFSLAALPLRTTGYLSNDTANASIDLVITNIDEPIKWAVGNGTWDIGTTPNWVDTLPVSTTYQELNGLGDAVLFDDTASGSSPITITLNTSVSPGSVTVNGTKNYSFTGSGGINGPGSVTKTGSGTLVLGTANAFAGGLNFNGGIVNFSSLANLGSGNLNFNGGTLQYNNNGDDISTRTIVLGPNGGTIDTANMSLFYVNPIANGSVGGLTITGGGNLALVGASKYTGPTTITGATLALAGNSYISNSSAIIVNSGGDLDTASYSANLTLSPSVSQILAGVGTVEGEITAPTGTTISPATNGVYGTLSFLNDLTISGGKLAIDISAANKDLIAVAGTITLTSGTLALNVSGTLPPGTYKLITYGALAGGAGAVGNLTVTGFSQPNAVATLSAANPGEIDLIVAASASDNLTWSGTGGSWDQAGTMDWLLNGVTSWAFTNGDIVRFDDTGIGSTTANLMAALLPSAVTVSNNAASPYVFADGTGTGGGKLGGTASLVKDGPGTLIVQTANTYTGPTTIKNGVLQIGNSGIGDLGTGPVTNNGSLVFAQGDAQVHTVAGVISGTGGLTQQGTARVALAQNNTYGGATLISSGGLQIGTGGSSGSLGTGTVTDNGALFLDRSNALAFTVPVSGSGTLVQIGSGTTTLASGLTYFGNTYVSNGVVKLTASEQIPDSLNVPGSTGWLILDGGGSSAGTFDLAGFNETVNALSGVPGALDGTITNSGTATSTTNILTVLGTAGTTFNGLITDNPTGSKTRLFVLGAFELRMNNTNATAGGVVVGGTATYGVGPGYLASLGGILMSNGTTYMMHNNGSTTPNAGDNITIVNGAGVTMNSSQLGNAFSGTVSGGPNSTNFITGPVSFNTGAVEQYTNMLGTVTVLSGGSLRFSASSLTLNGGDNTTFDLEGTGVLQTRNTGNVHVGALQGNGSITTPQANTGTGNFIIGSKNLSTAFTGNITGTNSIVKTGTGTLALNGLLSYVGNTTVSNGVLKLTVPAVLTNWPTPITLASPTAVLDASTMGYVVTDGATFTNLVTNGVLEVVSGQTLAGLGTIHASNVLADAGSTFNVGLPTGLLTVTGKVELAGAVRLVLNATNNSELAALSYTVDPGATLIVTNTGPALTNSIVYHLFSSAINTNNFASITLPTVTNPVILSNNLAVDGTLVIIAPVTINPNPTNIVFAVNGSSLNLSWPADHTGWYLQIQTNPVATGLGTNWVDLPGSQLVNSTNLTINPVNGSVFYRLSLQP